MPETIRWARKATPEEERLLATRRWLPKAASDPRACRACDNIRGNRTVKGEVRECAKCGAIFGNCYLGDSFGFVLPRMAAEPVAADRLRYFDLTTLGSQGVVRRHGWYDPETKLVHQIG